MNTIILLTNCEAHAAKYSDGSFDVRNENNDVRTKKLGSNIFSYGTNNRLIRALLYSHHEHVEKSSGSCREVVGKLSENLQNIIQRPFLWQSSKRH